MIDQRVGQAKPSGQQIKKPRSARVSGSIASRAAVNISTFCTSVDRGGDNGIHVDRLDSSASRNAMASCPRPDSVELVMNPGTLGIIDMAVGARRSDHHPHQRQREIAVDGLRVRQRSQTRRRCEQLRLCACAAFHRRLSGLVVFPGLVAETGNCRHATNLEG
jgi:hypothetical protein